MAPPFLNERLAEGRELWYTSPYLDEHGEPILTIQKLAGGAYFQLLYRDGTQFISDLPGTRLWATWPQTLTLDDIAPYLLGPAIGFMLRLRGITCLHASAVAVAEHAIALLGPPGAGKSTAAAAFASRDYPVLSDDVVTLWNEDESFIVQPGHPRLRLWPASLSALCGSREGVTPAQDKWFLDLRNNGYRFQEKPLPLAAIYVLGERSADPAAPFVQAEPPRDGLMALVANTFANRLLDKAMRAKEFELLGRVLGRVPVRRVTPHADLHYAPKLCDAVVDDFRAISATTPRRIGVTPN